MKKLLEEIVTSWQEISNCVHSIEEIQEWINEKNKTLTVEIVKTSHLSDKFWFFDEADGRIKNKNNSFFNICGLRKTLNDALIDQHPVIIQQEIGYLGIIAKRINGIIHFLMQAKVEPGNVNKIQISPTIQATKSNFLQKHGGRKPEYLDYFINANKHKIIVDQIQSEQSSRFYKKRNRNIILYVTEEIDVLDSHKWMTLGQIKQLLKKDNLVNMDTRTVISCLPFHILNSLDNSIKSKFKRQDLYYSIFNDAEVNLVSIFNYINDYKMFNDEKIELCRLDDLANWNITEHEIVCKTPYNYKVGFFDITIEGREVKKWTQPLFEAIGLARFGLFVCNDSGVMKFLVKARAEHGCFDRIELGPTIQLEPIETTLSDQVHDLFFAKLTNKTNILYDVILSEEGGRFFQEQNRNIIIEIDKKELIATPNGYFWCDYRTLNLMIQFNNTLNIQLRNLLSLLEVI